MSSTRAIAVECLCKQYRVGALGFRTLRQDLESGWARLRRRPDPNRPLFSTRPRERRGAADGGRFWALEDVSFEVEQGQVVGVLGKNGAGKSTLLKILSRVTAPTRGEARLRGRLASLLEVGTGFHPDLSGRENIYLNGAILGLTRREIRERLDEIVGFSGLEGFIDTPVKRYSTGMYMRLAFSVAAHLESEILLIDEVLAVGDAEFQRKCLGKVEDMSRHGRTVLFVSHNMNAIEELCTSAIWLHEGKVRQHSDSVRSLVSSYLDSVTGQVGDLTAMQLRENPWARLLGFEILDGQSRPVSAAVRGDEPLTVRIAVDVLQPDPGLAFGYALSDATGRPLYWSLTSDGSADVRPRFVRGEQTLSSAFPVRWLNEGVYHLHLWAGIHAVEWLAEPFHDAPMLQLELRGGLSDSEFWRERRPGVLAPLIPWTCDRGGTEVSGSSVASLAPGSRIG